MPAERWRPIDGWPYEVSDRGRVRRSSPACGTRPGRVLRLRQNKYGYLSVILQHTPRLWPALVHHLVLVAFVGVAPGPVGQRRNEFQANHRDGDKTNNTPTNLEWVTPAENGAHAARMGLRPRGERHTNAVLTDVKVRTIRERLRVGDSHRHIASEFGVSYHTIYAIRAGQTWKHVV